MSTQFLLVLHPKLGNVGFCNLHSDDLGPLGLIASHLSVCRVLAFLQWLSYQGLLSDGPVTCTTPSDCFIMLFMASCLVSPLHLQILK